MHDDPGRALVGSAHSDSYISCNSVSHFMMIHHNKHTLQSPRHLLLHIQNVEEDQRQIINNLCRGCGDITEGDVVG